MRKTNFDIYLAGFLDGFDNSGEGYNGEYTSPRIQEGLEERLLNEAKQAWKERGQKV